MASSLVVLSAFTLVTPSAWPVGAGICAFGLLGEGKTFAGSEAAAGAGSVTAGDASGAVVGCFVGCSAASGPLLAPHLPLLTTFSAMHASLIRNICRWGDECRELVTGG